MKLRIYGDSVGAVVRDVHTRERDVEAGRHDGCLEIAGAPGIERFHERPAAVAGYRSDVSHAAAEAEQDGDLHFERPLERRTVGPDGRASTDRRERRGDAIGD